MHFVLARVHAGTNGTVMKSGSQTKCAGNRTKMYRTSKTYRYKRTTFFDNVNPQFEILEKNSKISEKMKFRDDENPQDRDVFTNIYRENNRRPLSP